MKIQIISVGEPKKYFFKEAAEEYARRLEGFRAKWVRVKDNAHAYEKIESLSAGTYIIALDEQGTELASRQLARRLEELDMQGDSTISLVIGPSDGHPEDFLENVNYTLRLSKLTMPHEMALVFTLEAVYRALCIIQNHPYHRDRMC